MLVWYRVEGGDGVAAIDRRFRSSRSTATTLKPWSGYHKLLQFTYGLYICSRQREEEIYQTLFSFLLWSCKESPPRSSERSGDSFCLVTESNASGFGNFWINSAVLKIVGLLLCTLFLVQIEGVNKLMSVFKALLVKGNT